MLDFDVKYFKEEIVQPQLLKSGKGKLPSVLGMITHFWSLPRLLRVLCMHRNSYSVTNRAAHLEQIQQQ